MSKHSMPKKRTVTKCHPDKDVRLVMQHLSDILDYHIERLHKHGYAVTWRNCLLWELRDYIYDREQALKRFHWKKRV